MRFAMFAFAAVLSLTSFSGINGFTLTPENSISLSAPCRVLSVYALNSGADYGVSEDVAVNFEIVDSYSRSYYWIMPFSGKFLDVPITIPVKFYQKSGGMIIEDITFARLEARHVFGSSDPYEYQASGITADVTTNGVDVVTNRCYSASFRSYSSPRDYLIKVEFSAKNLLDETEDELSATFNYVLSGRPWGHEEVVSTMRSLYLDTQLPDGAPFETKGVVERTVQHVFTNVIWACDLNMGSAKMVVTNGVGIVVPSQTCVRMQSVGNQTKINVIVEQ